MVGGACPDVRGPTVLSIGEVIGLLSELGHRAAGVADPSRWHPARMTSYTGRLDPQVVYFQRVLWLWTDVFGGKLQSSHNASGEVSGPLVRYFFAVTRPVMGDETPSVESLPNIIERQRAFDDYVRAHWTTIERAELALTCCLP